VENSAGEKLSIIESAGVQILLIGVIIIIFLSAVIGWPIAFALRQQRPNHPAGARAAQWFTVVTALLFIFSLATIAAELSSDVYKYTYGVPAKNCFSASVVVLECRAHRRAGCVCSNLMAQTMVDTCGPNPLQRHQSFRGGADSDTHLLEIAGIRLLAPIPQSEGFIV
jgi:hypothetical protein